MKTKIFLYISLVLLINASACSNSVSPTTPALFPSPAIMATETVAPPTAALISMKDCWAIQNPQAADITGSLLYLEPQSNVLRALDINTGHYKNIDARVVPVSNDRTMIVMYVDGNIRILSEDTDRVYKIADPPPYFDSFLDHEHALLRATWALRDNYKEDSGTIDELYVLSLKTGEVTPMSINLPHFSSWSRDSYAKYSFDLRYVIYSAHYQGSGTNILLDIENNKIVWSGAERGLFGPPYGPFPMWKPDGKAVLFIQPDENHRENLYSLSINGQLSQITHLEDIFTWYEITQIAWSPDGRYVSFVLYFPSEVHDLSKTNYLFILDTKTHKIMNTCVALGYSTTEGPIWSPDSKYIAVVPWDKSRILITDLALESVYEIYKIPGVDVIDPFSGAIPVGLSGWVTWKTP